MALTTFSGPVVSQNGFLDSSFTTAERDAIVDPQPGLLIYNTTTNEYEVYNGEDFQPAFGNPNRGPNFFVGVDYDSMTTGYDTNSRILSIANPTINPNLSRQLTALPVGQSFAMILSGGLYNFTKTDFANDGPSLRVYVSPTGTPPAPGFYFPSEIIIP
jgi:hypothetical protein